MLILEPLNPDPWSSDRILIIGLHAFFFCKYDQLHTRELCEAACHDILQNYIL